MKTVASPLVPEREKNLSSLYLLAVAVTLATITVTFGSLALVFVLRSQESLNWLPIQLPQVLWVSSALLILSSAVYEFGRRYLAANRQRDFYRWTLAAAILGGLFLAGQMVAWYQLLGTGLLRHTNPHGGFIFLFSGLHGAHILVGLGGLIWLLARTREPASGPKYQMNTRVVARSVSIFWHYLDFVWLCLFALLLTWKR